jgi:hypothetical protein
MRHVNYNVVKENFGYTGSMGRNSQWNVKQ